MKIVLAQLRQYKKDSLLTMGFTILEVIMEVLLPFVTAMIIDEGLERSDLSAVARLGSQPDFRRTGRQVRGQRIFRLCLQFAGKHVCKSTGLFIFQY